MSQRQVLDDGVFLRRTSEAHFQEAISRLGEGGCVVGGMTVHLVGRFLPGGQEAYASAYVITSRSDQSGDNRFCTHLLVCPESIHWVLINEHGGLTWDEAVADLATR
jgi:hypothetical protein